MSVLVDAGIERTDSDGDRDPISAGTTGDAVVGGGSRVVVGMTANLFRAH